MNLKKFTLFFLVSFLLAGNPSWAQTKLKAGAGINYVSNDFPEDQLNDYLAFSFNLSYTILRRQNFSVAVESATTYKRKEENDKTSLGVVSSVPLTLQYQLNRSLIYAGAGPAFLRQKETSYQYNQSVSGPYLNVTAGVGLSAKTNILDVIYPEYNIRLSFLNSFRDNRENAGMISLILFLRGVE